MSFDRFDPANFMSVFQDQLLRNVEQGLELLKVGVLGNEQVILVLQSEMNCLSSLT